MQLFPSNSSCILELPSLPWQLFLKFFDSTVQKDPESVGNNMFPYLSALKRHNLHGIAPLSHSVTVHTPKRNQVQVEIHISICVYMGSTHTQTHTHFFKKGFTKSLTHMKEQHEAVSGEV